MGQARSGAKKASEVSDRGDTARPQSASAQLGSGAAASTAMGAARLRFGGGGVDTGAGAGGARFASRRRSGAAAAASAAAAPRDRPLVDCGARSTRVRSSGRSRRKDSCSKAPSAFFLKPYKFSWRWNDA